jgi:predicted TIM-barrel fold metal-dependent hydrolase
MPVKDDYYERVDLPVYREVVAPLLSDKILDIHAHARAEFSNRDFDRMAHKYPGRSHQPFPVEELVATGALMFPDQTYHALVFGMPFPDQYVQSNAHVGQECRQRSTLYPLYIPDMQATEEQVRQAVLEGGYYGFKPYWTMVEWKEQEDDVTILDMLPQPYMRVADDWGLMIMLHIPGSRRLASVSNIECIQKLSREYPQAKIIIAHLGRSYCPWSMKGGIEQLCDLPNVYWDTSFVQQSLVYKVFFDHVDPAKVMYGTDLPLAQTRGRRVCINDKWVDVTRDRLGWTASRDPQHPVEGTFMAYEMIRAMREGAEEAGLSVDDLRPIFFDNGMRLIEDTRHTLESLI